MITKDEVQHIVKLARLGLTETELEEHRKDLSMILDYIEKLKEVDVLGVEPMSHPLEIKNVMRKDERKTCDDCQKLMELAPETEKGYLKVKSILKSI